MTQRPFLDHVSMPSEQIHPMRGDLSDAAVAARKYERHLPATFDVTLLALGADAHVASIFPGGCLLDGRRDANRLEGRRVQAVWECHLNAWRITLTPTEVLNARAILVLATGVDKATAVHAALEAPMDLTRWPAQLLRAVGNHVEWIIDAADARSLAVSRVITTVEPTATTRQPPAVPLLAFRVAFDSDGGPGFRRHRLFDPAFFFDLAFERNSFVKCSNIGVGPASDLSKTSNATGD